MPAEDTADNEVLYAVARGDRNALGLLYARHARVMLALARRIMHDARDAEDVVHDAFIEVWHHAGDFDPRRASVRAWLLLRTRSRCLDRVRSAGVRRRVLREAGNAEAVVQSDAAEAFDRRKLRGALAQLGEEQRRVLEQGYVRGLSSQEIASALGIPLGTVKSRVSSALAQLRRALSDTSAVANGKEPAS